MAETSNTPARSVEEITRDIAVEREALASAFESISGTLQQTVDSAAQKSRAAAHNALVAVPVAAAAAGALIGAAALLRRRGRHARRSVPHGAPATPERVTGMADTQDKERRIIGATVGGAAGGAIGAALGGRTGATIGGGVSSLVGHWVEHALRRWAARRHPAGIVPGTIGQAQRL